MTPLGARHIPVTEADLGLLPVGTVLSFDLGKLRVSAVKTHPERWTLHTRTVPSEVLAQFPATERVLRASAR